MPFSWTVNPYRGCTHACVYCLAGDTPVLMGDRRVKPLADLRPGNTIFGTQQVGRRRRYVKTTVEAHWQTSKPAYRVVLSDGAMLTASADHMFLTTRGWRQVDELTLVDQMIGSDRLRRLPKHARGRSVEGHAVSTEPGLRVISAEPLGAELPMYDITTGTGDFIANGVVSHNCFARGSHSWLELDTGVGFDTEIVVKVNAPDVLARELRRPSWQHEHVALGTNTDPYQRAEGRYRLMPGIIRALTASGTPFSILTKGTLLRRDLPLLQKSARDVSVGLAVSVAIHDADLHEALEPGTPSPRARLDLVRAIRDSGFDCRVLVAPVIPWLTDSVEQLDGVLAALAAAGASGVTPIPLHLRPGAREWFFAWLRRERPELVPAYERLYGRGAYVPRHYSDWLTKRLEPLLAKHGLDDATTSTRGDSDVVGDQPDGTARTEESRRQPVGPEQLTLL
jgi:DNA repair photolyase